MLADHPDSPRVGSCASECSQSAKRSSSLLRSFASGADSSRRGNRTAAARPLAGAAVPLSDQVMTIVKFASVVAPASSVTRHRERELLPPRIGVAGSWHTPGMVAFTSGRRVTAVALVVVALVAAVVLYIVRRGSDSEPENTATDELHGPLCDALPAGDDPGGPEQLAGLDAAVALTWIPVLTIFEAGTRAAGLTTELADADGLTILAPSDDAFLLALGQETLDDLIIFRNAELRQLLESHLVDESLTLRDLAAVGR